MLQMRVMYHSSCIRQMHVTGLPLAIMLFR